jgi:hypothetical protein
MAGRNAFAAEMVTIEKFLISNYVRLCIAEGIKPRDAYEELERRLEAIKELKNQEVTQNPNKNKNTLLVPELPQAHWLVLLLE